MYPIEDYPIFDKRNVSDFDKLANRSNGFVAGLLETYEKFIKKKFIFSNKYNYKN